MSWYDGLLWPFMWAIAWVMVTLHKIFEWIGLDPASGAAWTLSIIGLTLIVRALLIPLFFRQIRASRGLQLIQPEIQALQKKYKGKTDPASREAMAREQMELYKKHNTNPFSSCLPILAQSPIFFALYRMLYSLPRIAQGTYGGHASIGPLTKELARQAEKATLFGAPLSSSFTHATLTSTRIVTVVLILGMSGAQFFTQRQLTMKNMPPSALEGPFAQQQKMIMYLMPLMFVFIGINMPVGVLVYWTTTNLWTVGQQFYAIRRMPAPGSEAEAAMKARRERKVATRGDAVVDVAPVAVIDEKVPPTTGQRQQPMSKARAKKQAQKRPVTDATDLPAYGAAPEPSDTADETAKDAPDLGLDALGALEEKARPDADVVVPARPNKPKKPKKS